MTKRPILITGATGRTGRRITDLLEADGLPVRAASRQGEPPFDWHDRATWDALLDGCTAAYLCYSPDLALPGADEVIAGFAERAVAHGVGRLVLLSGRGEEGAQRCEQLVLGASPSATVVRCAWFQENFSEHFLRDHVLAGRIALPAGSVREPFVGLDDVAEVATLALTGGAHAGQVLELTGPESITFAEAAEILSVALGRAVTYEEVTPAELVTELVAAGVAPADASGLAWLFEEVLDGRNSAVTTTVEQVLGRPATSFRAYADRAAAAGAWAPEAEEITA
jgi:uncharacterized protein YbjT (DUF2867 family)